MYCQYQNVWDLIFKSVLFSRNEDNTQESLLQSLTSAICICTEDSGEAAGAKETQPFHICGSSSHFPPSTSMAHAGNIPGQSEGHEFHTRIFSCNIEVILIEVIPDSAHK